MASVRPLRVITLSNFVCLQCRLHASAAARRQNPSSKPLITSRQYASLTDRLRKKIWGSENPPGQEDPYGGKSILDQRKKELDLEDERRDPRVQVAPSPEDVEDESVALGYVAKTTWDGMDRVGYEGWGKEEWDKDHPFKGFVDLECWMKRILNCVYSYMNSKRTNRQEIMTGIHRALVEVYTLKQEGLPLTDYSAFDLDDDYARRLAEGTKFEDDAFQGKRLVFENEELRQQVLESTKAKDGLVEETDQQEALEAAEYAEEEATGREAEPIPEQETTASIVSRDDVEGEPHADDELADEASEAACYHILGGEYLIKPTDDSWREISFEDPHVKFAVSRSLRPQHCVP